MVLLVFLSVQLLVKRNMDKLNFHKLLGFSCPSPNSRCSSTEWNHKKDPTRDFKTVMAWWQEMAQQNSKCNIKPDTSSKCLSTVRKGINVQRENAATIIQSNYRRLMKRRSYLRIIDAVIVLQSFALAWLSAKKKVSVDKLGARSKLARGKHLEKYGMYLTFMVDRHYFVNLKKSVTVIQRAARAWIEKNHYNGSTVCSKMHTPDLINAAIVIQSCIRGWMVRSLFDPTIKTKEKGSVLPEEERVGDLQAVAAIKIQHYWKKYVFGKSLRRLHYAATKIQSHYRGWLMRRSYACEKKAIITIQGIFRCLKNRRNFEIHIKESAIIIQSNVRGWMARRQAYRKKQCLINIQSYCRGWLQRKEFLLQKNAVTKIQSAFRCMNFQKAFVSQRRAAIDIQRYIRGENTRKRLLGSFCRHNTSNQCFKGLELKIFLQAVVKLQRWWRDVQQVKLKTNSALIIQSHIRGWLARQIAKRIKHHAIVIQSHWKGYVARKNARGQLVDLRLRMQKSAANIDDSMRLINRLIAALHELLSMRSVSGIMHTCATLDVATELSQKCCEELVAAGAVGTLLKLIRSVSRSIPDQQVLKHALSTLRNLARYPHVTQVLVDTPGCLETVILEFIRNKEEGYFIASDLLKRICANENGAKAIRKSPALSRRLNNLAEELSRKAGNDKRNARNLVGREHADKRLREVVLLLKLIANA